MNPVKFGTLVYAEPWHNLKPWSIQNPVKYIHEEFYSQYFVTLAYLDS